LYISASRRDQAAASITWSPDGLVTVRKGEDLSVTCTVSDISDPFAVTRLVHTQGLETHPISDNDALKAPYSELSRYSVTYTYTGSTAVITLNYDGTYIQAFSFANTRWAKMARAALSRWAIDRP